MTNECCASKDKCSCVGITAVLCVILLVVAERSSLRLLPANHFQVSASASVSSETLRQPEGGLTVVAVCPGTDVWKYFPGYRPFCEVVSMPLSRDAFRSIRSAARRSIGGMYGPHFVHWLSKFSNSRARAVTVPAVFAAALLMWSVN